MVLLRGVNGRNVTRRMEGKQGGHGKEDGQLEKEEEDDKE